VDRRARYQVIPRTLIFVFQQDNILLMRKEKWRNRYNALGGHLERGEDVLTGAARELNEEAGISGLTVEVVGNILIDDTEMTGICVFLIRCDAADQHFVQGDEGELAWIALNDLSKVPVIPDLPDLVARVKQHHPDSPFITLHYTRDQSI